MDKDRNCLNGREYWHSKPKAPKLPEEKEPAMSEFEGKSGKWAWEIQKEQQAKVEELQKRLDGALKEAQFALQYVEEDMRGNHEFLQMAMIRTLKALEQVLKGGESK
ncbi:hypothetical protein [Acinetobacter baumannii]|uniref:hypothetical protein n=1 Tax=Acinetobacter baumannii TaxID=470 RepID=UPI0039170EE4